MSDDGYRWCKEDNCYEHVADSYTLLPVHHKHASSKFVITHVVEPFSRNLICNLRQHRNCNRINRDISDIRTCSDDSGQTCKHSTTQKSRRSHRLINLCVMIMIHVLCNQLVTSVNCDELLESVGARGHFTHTWAVHILGGDEVAKQVANDHGMYLRGKVSQINSEISRNFSSK